MKQTEARSLSHSASQPHLLGLPWLCFLPEQKNTIDDMQEHCLGGSLHTE